MKYLAIENTFDDFSISILENFFVKKTFTKSISSEMYKNYGGLVPPLSFKEHVNNLPGLVSNFNEEDIKDLEFLCFASEPGLKKNILLSKFLCKAIQLYIENYYFSYIPIIPINHIKCHLLSCFINEKYDLKDLDNSFFFLITGAHTSIYKISCDLENKVIQFTPILETIDEAIGSVIDKIARMNNFLHAAEMCDKIKNANYIDDLHFPNIRNNPFFSFSGLYTHVKKILGKYSKNDLCFTIQKKIFNYLLYRLDIVRKQYNIKKVFFGGGVVRNKIFRDILDKNDYFYLPENEFSSDNASMIGIGGYLSYSGWTL